MKIQNKILIGVLIVLISSLSIISVISIQLSRNALFNKIRDNTILLSEGYAEELNTQFINYGKILETLSTSIVTAINIEEVLMQQQRLYPEFHNLFYTNTSGRVIELHPYKREYQEINFMEKPYWRDSFAEKRYTISDVTTEFGYEGIVFSSPVLIHYGGASEPDIQGVVSVVIPIDKLFNRIKDIVVGDSGFLFIIDNNGNILSHKENSYILNKKLMETSNSNHLLGIQNAMISLNTGAGLYNNDDGDKYFISFAPIPIRRWSLGVTGDLSEFTQDIDSLIVTNIIILIISVVVTIIIIYLVVHKIVKPIYELMGTIKKIEDGDLDVRSSVKTKDELGKLSNAFNTMTDKLQKSFRKIKDYNENLEQMVEERTEELNKANQDLEKSIEEITGLKVKQDGDYFLTSLLIEPILTNNTESKNIKTEFYISQKKKFTFRGKKYELGGDICIAHTIILNDNGKDKEFTVFVNGDAMGKSIQGAGGSLVLGVVFNAIVNRTKYVPGHSRISPEEWLIRCFRELQDVFRTFDGTMLISVVLGIIEDKTGMLYYFNAEHPWSVIYRDGEASFMEEELLNRKIGTTIGMSKVKLQTYQLKSGDTIIAGSDGRDDLLLGYDEETGLKIINEDENLFLDAVEKGDGNLKKIVKQLKRRGELTDDISLLKITYKEEEKLKKSAVPNEYYENKAKGIEAYQKKDYDNAIKYFEEALIYHKNNKCYNMLINSYIKIENYNKALFVVEKALNYFSGSLEIIFNASFLYKKLKEFDKAIYYGRRYYIRIPEDINNLINMADAYRLSKNYAESLKYLNEAETIDDKNNNVKRLKELLDSISNDNSIIVK